MSEMLKNVLLINKLSVFKKSRENRDILFGNFSNKLTKVDRDK